MLTTSEQGKILREGNCDYRAAECRQIFILNSFVQEKKAIVTDIPGTTRDVIEEYVNVRGVPLRLR